MTFTQKCDIRLIFSMRMTSLSAPSKAASGANTPALLTCLGRNLLNIQQKQKVLGNSPYQNIDAAHLFHNLIVQAINMFSV